MEQPELLRYAFDALERQGVPYMLVGSLASMLYGEPRMTRDIDFVVDLPVSRVEALCAEFPSPEFYVSLPAARKAAAQGGQFNVIHPSSGNKIDLMIARRDAWGRTQLARRLRKEVLQGTTGFVASPEDVILAKLWYYQDGGSDKHLRDIAAMLQISGTEIDRNYIEEWAAQLGLVEPWRAVIERLASGGWPS